MLFCFFVYQTKKLQNTRSLQEDSSLDHWSRRRLHWPLDHYGPRLLWLAFHKYVWWLNNLCVALFTAAYGFDPLKGALIVVVVGDVAVAVVVKAGHDDAQIWIQIDFRSEKNTKVLFYEIILAARELTSYRCGFESLRHDSLKEQLLYWKQLSYGKIMR